jgi:hypothetical protein
MRRLHVLGAFITVLALTMVGCGGGSGHPGTTAPSATVGAAQAKARRDLCEDLLLIQSGFRPDALARLLPELKHDAAEFAHAGDRDGAREVHRLVVAVRNLRTALINQQGVSRAQNQVEAILSHLPSC